MAKVLPRSLDVPNRLQTRLKNSVMFVGDSLTNNGFQSSSNGTTNHGYAFWTKVFSEGRIKTPLSLNFGVGGDKTQDVLNRMSTIISSSTAADVAVLLIGANDSGSIDIEVAKQNYRNIVDMLQEAGKVVCAVTITPRQPANKTQENFIIEFRRFILEEVSGMGCLVADPWGDLWDQTRGVVSPKAHLFIDDLHPNPKGAQLIGKTVWNTLNLIFGQRPGVSPLPVVYDGTLNAWGSINANPRMGGTGGTVGVTGNSTVGSVLADSWTSSGTAFTNVTSTLSKIVENGVEKQVIQLGGTAGTGAVFIIHNILTVANLVNTQKYKAIFKIEVESGADSLSGVYGELRIVDGGTTFIRDGNNYSESVGMLYDGFSGILETDPYTASGTKTDVRVRIAVVPVIGVNIKDVKVKISTVQVVRVL